MASANDVTVVIPCDRRHVEIAQRAILSAINSDVRNVILVLDGFSKTRIKHSYGNVVILEAVQPFLVAGVSVARNVGIEALTDDSLVLPLDADDYLTEGAVERMAAAWSEGKVIYGNWQVDNELFVAPPPEMLSRKHVCHSTFLFHRQDWKLTLGGYDPDFNIGAEDWAFMIALVNAGCELVRLDGDPLYIKTLNEDGRTHKAIAHKEMIKQLLLEKYPRFFQK